MFSWVKKSSGGTSGGTCVQERPSAATLPEPAFEQAPVPAPAPKPSAASDLIDVKKLMRELTVEELCETAENYIAHLTSWDYQLAKPFASIVEAPLCLNTFAQLLQRMDLVAEMTILDFGAGTCWLSRYLTQLGLEVIALDASASALKIGQELYARQPIIGNKPQPRYLVFKGHTIDLPDRSVDRIICMDAFHHVPNPQEVLAEMSRVLKDGGIAGFAEPGPEHSKNPQSQYEMKHYRVVENDIILRDIWAMARKVGFTDIKAAAFTLAPTLMSLDDFDDYLAGGHMTRAVTDQARHEMRNHRLFLLYKGAPAMPDSRMGGDALGATLKVTLTQSTVKEGESFQARISAKNTGRSIWLPSTANIGAVRFGAHLCDAEGAVTDLNFFRDSLGPGKARVMPGETVSFEVEIPAPPKGRSIIEFDLVAEQVTWFSMIGTKTVRIPVEVV